MQSDHQTGQAWGDPIIVQYITCGRPFIEESIEYWLASHGFWKPGNLVGIRAVKRRLVPVGDSVPERVKPQIVPEWQNAEASERFGIQAREPTQIPEQT